MKPRRHPARVWPSIMVIGCLGLYGLPAGVRAEPSSVVGDPRVGRARQESVTNVDEEKQLKEINKQLDEILEVQTTILQRYDELMEQLQIVKVRSSR